MMSIRDLLDYYARNQLSFHEVMELYKAGEITLEGGIAHPSDLDTICRVCDLPRFDMRKVKVEKVASKKETPTDNDANPDRLLSRAATLESKVFKMGRALRKKWKKEDTTLKDSRSMSSALASEINLNFSERVELASLYEKLYEHHSSEHSYLNSAIRYRREAENEYALDFSRGQQRERAENLVTLSALEYRRGDHENALKSLEAAEMIYTLIIDIIRSTEAQMRTEENAKLGLIQLRRYYITKKSKYLNHAETLLESYTSLTGSCDYDDYLLEIFEIKENSSANDK
jgi:hypothetical protein